MTEDFGDGKRGQFCGRCRDFLTRGKALEDDARKILRRGIDSRVERREIVQIVVVEIVQNCGKRLLCNLEVDQHSELIKLSALKRRFDHPVVPVQTVAFAGVVHDAVRRLKRALNA